MAQSSLKPARTDESPDFLEHVFEGYRFGVCQDPWQAERALEVRRQVYVTGSGYDVPVPDDLDRRSWLFYAEDLSTQRVVGTMRVTPRFAGPLECEDYFQLPAHFTAPRTTEVNRFAILPEYRKGKTFIPVVSLGLFKLNIDFQDRLGTHYMVICSKPERTWTYEWLRFRRTGRTACYGSLGGAMHELLDMDFRDWRTHLAAGHPFEPLFLGHYPQVVVPRRVPALGLAGETAARRARLAVA